MSLQNGGFLIELQQAFTIRQITLLSPLIIKRGNGMRHWAEQRRGKEGPGEISDPGVPVSGHFSVEFHDTGSAEGESEAAAGVFQNALEFPGLFMPIDNTEQGLAIFIASIHIMPLG